MKTVKIISINVLILLIILAIMDPFLGDKRKDDPKLMRSLHMRELGPNRYVVLDPVGHDVDTSLLDSKRYVMQTDKHGFIAGPSDTLDGIPEVIFFGGSTTECSFVDDSLRYPYLVGKRLKRTVRNAGFGGNHSFHSINNLLGKGINMNPERVVWMHNINDLALLSKTGSYFESPQNRKIINESLAEYNPSFWKRGKRFISSLIFFLYPNTSGQLKRLTKRSSGKVDEWAGYRDGGKVRYDEMESRYRASLESFIGIAQAHDIEVTLMTQFNRIQLGTDDVEESLMKKHRSYTYPEIVKYYKGFNQVIRDVAREKELQLIDLDSLVPKSPTLFYDAVHLNNAGSRITAQIIADALSQEDTLFTNKTPEIKVE